MTAGSTAILPVTVTATLAGAQARIRGRRDHGAARAGGEIEVVAGDRKLVAGQRLRATARASRRPATSVPIA